MKKAISLLLCLGMALNLLSATASAYDYPGFDPDSYADYQKLIQEAAAMLQRFCQSQL